MDVSELPAPTGPWSLTDIDPSATPGWSEGKAAGRAHLESLGPELADLQERLFAEGRTRPGARRVLLVLQGMDTSGKGGTVRKVMRLLDPQGVRVASFSSPTPEELSHDFLWRVRPRVPAPGQVGVFDRSHYEDVLIARVRSLVPADEVERRYAAIRDFEAELVAGGTRVVKVLLHVSPDEQRRRLLERLDDPTKHWKFSPADIDDRALWADYQRAYEIAVERTTTPDAPWFVVPAESKWYRNLAVASLLLRELRALDLEWPSASFDPDEQRRRLVDADPLATAAEQA
ncbi:polyphosphate kinase 2 family protein [Nocardioides zeae]|uniref:Polyphosphate kinase 2 family protein n=1 Tax=Nocardioides imazamoxiresistens TaxID=3231893 RepID=A0ABU3PTN6_9ACTN|nr:PPK2 family polyphosphate kinase [Nocardioides zeae]MDT9592573.1 polyphosphate kinase 2 family protein [Nocardioides zeae]